MYAMSKTTEFLKNYLDNLFFIRISNKMNTIYLSTKYQLSTGLKYCNHIKILFLT